MSQPEKLELTEERLAIHNRAYEPSFATHSLHARQLVEGEKIRASYRNIALNFLNNDQQTADSFTGLLGRENKSLNKSTLEHPLERFLTPGDLSEPTYFAKQALKAYGFEYGSRASVAARKKQGHLNFVSTMLNARATQTVKSTCGDHKRYPEFSSYGSSSVC
ncbi:hypothetical protein AJ78_06069 [Emergomyces pasteurianus Ep9510]|uniref:Uncharacterized protein n=1 Tax=Emergomyces pasteurianus Ep9510 TaxID=1447872 RepID=A0A1J9QBF3_9EURO|nr:hypothetical protein AJ78_06069 [Emergomyces pasteurianus Ep9510]